MEGRNLYGEGRGAGRGHSWHAMLNTWILPLLLKFLVVKDATWASVDTEVLFVFNIHSVKLWKYKLFHAALSLNSRCGSGRGSASLGRVVFHLFFPCILCNHQLEWWHFFSTYRTNETRIVKSLYKAKPNTVAFKYHQLRRAVKCWSRHELR